MSEEKAAAPEKGAANGAISPEEPQAKAGAKSPTQEVGEEKGYRVGEYRTKKGPRAAYFCTTPKCRFGTLSEKAIEEHLAAGHDEFRRSRRRQRRAGQ